MQIKKSRLMQIIKEELARIEEVEVVRRRRRSPAAEKEVQLFTDFIEAFKKGDKQTSNAVMTELYPILKKKAVGYLSSKQIKTATEDDLKDFFHDKLISTIFEKPDLIDPNKSLPSSFTMNNVWNEVTSDWRRKIKYGGTPTISGDVTDVSNRAQKANMDFNRESDPRGGSRYPSPEASTITRDFNEKLLNRVLDKLEGDKNATWVANYYFTNDLIMPTGAEMMDEFNVNQGTTSKIKTRAAAAIEAAYNELQRLEDEEQARYLQEISMNPGSPIGVPTPISHVEIKEGDIIIGKGTVSGSGMARGGGVDNDDKIGEVSFTANFDEPDPDVGAGAAVYDLEIKDKFGSNVNDNLTDEAFNTLADDIAGIIYNDIERIKARSRYRPSRPLEEQIKKAILQTLKENDVPGRIESEIKKMTPEEIADLKAFLDVLDAERRAKMADEFEDKHPNPFAYEEYEDSRRESDYDDKLEEAGGYPGRDKDITNRADGRFKPDDLPTGHTDIDPETNTKVRDGLKQRPFAGKLEEIIAEVVSELMNQ